MQELFLDILPEFMHNWSMEDEAMAARTDKSRKAGGRGGSANAQVLEIRRKLGMPQRLFSRLLGVSERSLAKFEKGEVPSDVIKRQVHAVARLQEALGRVMEVDQVGQWFQQPNEAFNGLTPLEVVERGEIDRLWAMVYELESGVPA